MKKKHPHSVVKVVLYTEKEEKGRIFGMAIHQSCNSNQIDLVS